MNKLIISLFLFIAASAQALACNDITLYNGNIIDTDNGVIKYNQTIVVRDGKIHQISPAKKRIRKGETDVTGKFIIPGMIDSHTHYGNFCEDQSKAAELSAEYLKQGVTTVRDVGGNYLWIERYNKDRQKGLYHGPDIYYSSIWATGAFDMPAYHSRGSDRDDTAWSRMLSIRESSDEELEKAVIEAKEIGCTGFKLYINYSSEDLARLIPIIRKHGMKVWIHSAQVSGATSLEVAEAGVDVMSHSYLIPKNFYPHKYLSDKEKDYVGEVLDKMKANDIVLDFTLLISWRGGSTFAADVTRMAYEKGLKFVIGTDLPGCEFLNEIYLLSKECGISNIDLLRAATLTGAEILDQKDRIGVIDEGAEADIVILSGNPLEDISTLDSIEMTIADGKVVYTSKKNDNNKLTLYNANIVDTESGKVKYSRTIHINNGKISDITRAAKQIKDGETDMSGKFVMPGMIDSHVHWSNFAHDQDLVRDFLASGVTTVRDVGSNCLKIKEYRDKIRNGDFCGPEVFYSSLWAAGDYFMDPRDTIGWNRKEDAPWSRKINVDRLTDDEIEKAVIQAKEAGCSGFKLYINYSKEDLARMIPLMKKHGMKVWAHATQVNGANALEMAASGVDVVSHAYMLADDISPREKLTSYEREYVRKVCKELRRNNVTLDITAYISAFSDLHYGKEITTIAYQEGVSFVVGTDFFCSAILEEIDYLKKCGISNKDILYAATVAGAEILDFKDRIGSLVKGAEADIIIMERNPLEDLDALKDIRMTIVDGQCAYSR